MTSGTRLAPLASMGKPCETADATPFYVDLLQMLQKERFPFLVGGSYSFAQYTGIRRPTKDLDIFICRRDWPRLVQLAAAGGHCAELVYAHWLGKVRDEAGYVDVIFNSGNGVSPVDDEWFSQATHGHVLGLTVDMVPVEETIWTKAFVMERERYDGADVAHLIHACTLRLNWARLRRRFGPHWRVLFSHLVLFGFIFPGERSLVPRWLMDELTDRLHSETHGASTAVQRCGGTLLSREQYLPDVTHRGYEDSRLAHGTMTIEEVADWTAAIASPAADKPRD